MTIHRRKDGRGNVEAGTINYSRIRPVGGQLSDCSSMVDTSMALVLAVRRFLLVVAFSFSVAVESVDGGTSIAMRARPAISQADTRAGYRRRKIMKDHRGLYIEGLQSAGATGITIVERRYS